jgi:hypothetical protein
MARRIRKFFQKNFEKRSADWTPEKKAKRLKIREGTVSALKAVGSITGSVAGVASGGTVGAVLAMTDTMIDAAVADDSQPDFTPEVADVLKSPLMKKAAAMAQEFIDLIEEEMNIDIPDVLEERIVRRAVDVLADQFDELADAAEDQIEGLIDSGVAWIKGFFD